MTNTNPRKATGADGISAWLLKLFHEELEPVVQDIISVTLTESPALPGEPSSPEKPWKKKTMLHNHQNISIQE